MGSFVSSWILQLTQDVILNLFQFALLPETFLPFSGEGKYDVEVHVGAGEETVSIFAEEIGVPGFYGGIGIGFRLQVDHLAGILHDEGMGRQGGKKFILLGGNVSEHIRQGSGDDVLRSPDNLNAHGVKGHFFFGEIQLQQHAQVGVQVDALVVGVENKVAQGIENGLAVIEELVVFGTWGWWLTTTSAPSSRNFR